MRTEALFRTLIALILGGLGCAASPADGAKAIFSSSPATWYSSAWRIDTSTWLASGRTYLADIYAKPKRIWHLLATRATYSSLLARGGGFDWRTGTLAKLDGFDPWQAGSHSRSGITLAENGRAKLLTSAEAAMIGVDDPRFLPLYADAYGTVGFDGTPLTALDDDWSLNLYAGHATPFGFGFADTIVRMTRGGYSTGIYAAYRF